MPFRQKTLAQAIREAGGVDCLPEITGPKLEHFDAHALANAIKQEVIRSKIVGLPKLSLHMDLEDALVLARFLESR
jgi:hypothetical protein